MKSAKHLKIWLLSHLENSPGNAVFLAAAKRRGHQAQLVRPGAADLLENSELPDIVFPRMGASAPVESLKLLDKLSELGIPFVNSRQALEKSRDKATTAELLRAAGVAIPQTILLDRNTALAQQAATIPGPPWIAKQAISTKGQGVFLLPSIAELEQLLIKDKTKILLQEFIAESAASDIRVTVAGGKALAAVRRTNRSGNFRSNVYQGGAAAAERLTPELERLAVSATTALGLDLAGIDILESKRGLLVLEVNGSPGLESLNDYGDAGVDRLFEYLEQRAANAAQIGG